MFNKERAQQQTSNLPTLHDSLIDKEFLKEFHAKEA